MEDIADKILSKKRKKPVKIKMEDEMELEYEREDMETTKAQGNLNKKK